MLITFCSHCQSKTGAAEEIKTDVHARLVMCSFLRLQGLQPLKAIKTDVHVCLIVGNSLWLQGLQPARLLYPWDSPGKNTGAGCHALLRGIFLTQGSNPYISGGFFTMETPGKPLSLIFCFVLFFFLSGAQMKQSCHINQRKFTLWRLMNSPIITDIRAKCDFHFTNSGN